MKKLITTSIALFIVFTAGNVYAKSASGQVGVLVKVEPILKLEIDEKSYNSIQPRKSVLIKPPNNLSCDIIKKDYSSKILMYTVTE